MPVNLAESIVVDIADTFAYYKVRELFLHLIASSSLRYVYCLQDICVLCLMM